MGAFTPFKRRANQFKYTPRYYDPTKEAREERREELFGRRSDDSGEGSYQPGQYIRRQRDARSARMKNKGKNSSMRMWMSVVVIIIIAYMGSLLYNKLIEVFGLTEGSSTRIERSLYEYEEFDPTTPITIVPNDYDPTQEE
ncbi:MAG: hypothetical protein R3Y39_04435 [Rikenellaceae bacterium]